MLKHVSCQHLLDSKHKSQDYFQSGQIGLITLLIMGVVLTIAISLSQRTVQEQQVATTQDESTRAFNIAEIGIERGLADIRIYEETGGALDTDDQPFEKEGDEGKYKIDDRSFFEMTVGQNRTTQLALDGSAGNATINWHKGGGCTDTPSPAAILVSVYGDGGGSGQFSAVHYGLDPCSRGTGFQMPNPGDGDYSYKYVVLLASNDRILRVRPLYSSSEIQISSNRFEGAAQYDVQSYGAATETARSIHVRRSRMSVPTYMEFTLLSGEGSLAK